MILVKAPTYQSPDINEPPPLYKHNEKPFMEGGCRDGPPEMKPFTDGGCRDGPPDVKTRTNQMRNGLVQVPRYRWDVIPRENPHRTVRKRKYERSTR